LAGALYEELRDPPHGKRRPAPETVAEVKRLVKQGGDKAAAEASELLFSQLKTDNSQIRLLTLEIVDVLFCRSATFRARTAARIRDLISLTVGVGVGYGTTTSGTSRRGGGGGGHGGGASSGGSDAVSSSEAGSGSGAGTVLPGPNEFRSQLRDRALALLVLWTKSFSERYPELRVAVRYLKETHRLKFPTTNDGRSDAARRAPNPAAVRLAIARYHQAKREMLEERGIDEAEALVRETEAGLHVLVPTIEEEAEWRGRGRERGSGHAPRLERTFTEDGARNGATDPGTNAGPADAVASAPGGGGGGGAEDEDEDDIEWEDGAAGTAAEGRAADVDSDGIEWEPGDISNATELDSNDTGRDIGISHASLNQTIATAGLGGADYELEIDLHLDPLNDDGDGDGDGGGISGGGGDGGGGSSGDGDSGEGAPEHGLANSTLWDTLRESSTLLQGKYRQRLREWLGATTGADLTSEPHEQRICHDLIERLLELKQRSNEVCAKCREVLPKAPG